jgi:elongation factor Ts
MDERPASNLSGAVTSYTHSNGKIGVLVEVTCNSDFVARSDEFKELLHELALQIAAASPTFIRKEDIPAEQAERQQNTAEVCLYDQPFIKDNSVTILQLITGYAAKLGENLNVTRFARFGFGDPDAIVASSNGHGPQPTGDDLSGVPVRTPRPPKAGGSSAAAKMGTEPG